MAGITQRDLALEITHKLRGAGFEALWAGGCVRDQLLGLEPKDYDVATNARPEQVQELFGRRCTLAIGASFGVIAVLKKGCHPVEVATFRSDGAYVDGRRPSTVEYTTAEQDAQRRDFTINGMFFDPVDAQVIDYVGGQADLHDRIVRAIGNPQARFAEDKLRMVRAVRFATTLSFELDHATLAAIKGMASEIRVISAERVGAELTRLMVHPQRSAGVKLLYASGLLQPLVPELAAAAMHNSASWQKTLELLEHLESHQLGTALAALLFEFRDQVKVTSMGRRFRFANVEIDLAEWLGKHLPYLAEAQTVAWPTLQRVLVDRRAGELLSLARAAYGSQHAGVQHCQRCLALPPEKLNPPPLLTGDDLVRHGYPPGPYFAKVLRAVRDAQLAGHLSNQGDALVLAERLINEAEHS